MSQFPGQTSSYGVYSQPPVRRGMPTWVKVLLILISVGAVLIVLVCGGLMYIGATSPDTKAVSGSQMRKGDLETIQRLQLLEPGEQIQYFYSTGILDVESGMSFFTDRKVVAYSDTLAEPAATATFDQIADIAADFSDSWLVDTSIWVQLHDGTEIVLLVSIEGGGDQRFFDALVAMWERKRERTNSGRFA